MNKSAVTAFISAMYRSRLSNNVDDLVGYFSPGATLRIAGAPESSPIARASADPASMHRQLAQLVSAWRWEEYSIVSIVSDGDTAAVHYRLKATFQPTGDKIDTEIGDFITFKDGKIASFVQFVDTAKVVELAVKATRS